MDLTTILSLATEIYLNFTTRIVHLASSSTDVSTIFSDTAWNIYL